MASKNGNTVSGGSASAGTAYSWYCIVQATVKSETSTSITYTVSLKYYTRYAISVNSNGALSGGVSGSWSGSMTGTNSGTTKTVLTKTATVSKGSSSKSVSFSGYIQNTGGFGNGKSSATLSVTVPAIDYDTPNAPSGCSASRVSDSQAKVSWSNGSTSTTRPRSSTKVERQTDGGSWTQVASVGASTTNYTDNGISANHRYRYRVRAYGSGGYSGYATSGYIYTTPAAPTAVSLVKTTDTQVQVSISGAAPWATSYQLQHSLNSGAWTDVATVTSWPYVDTPGGGVVTYRVRAAVGSLYSAWTQSAEIATITPPNAPSVSLSPSDAVFAVGTAVTVNWVPDHPDGSAQSSAQVEVTVAGSATTYDVSGSATGYALPATALDAPATVSVRVRTKGLDPDWGAWSSPVQFSVAYPPSVSITVPGIDGATVADLPLVARWSVDDSTGVSEQQLRLYEGGSLVYSASVPTNATRFEFDDSTYRLDNQTDYVLELTVRGGSTLSTTETRDFSTDFAQPEAPTGLLSIDHGDMSCAIQAVSGPSSSDEGNPVLIEGREGIAMGGIEVYGQTRQNLWKNPSGTSNGVTVTSNEDGIASFSGTTIVDSGNWIGSQNDKAYVLAPGKSYAIAIDSSMTSGVVKVQVTFYNKDGTQIYATASTTTSNTFVVPSGTAYSRRVFVTGSPVGTEFSGTARVMLREATEDEIAALQQTAGTLQDGGTADLDQEQLENTPMLLPELYADEPFEWCPPGLTSVSELMLNTSEWNLLSKDTDDWVLSHSGLSIETDQADVILTANNVGSYSAAYMNFGEILNGKTVLIKCDDYSVESGNGRPTMQMNYVVDGVTKYHSSNINAPLTIPSNCSKASLYLYFNNANTQGVTGTIRYKAPRLCFSDTGEGLGTSISSTPIDLQGNVLAKYGDARDVLNVDDNGACSIESEVDVLEIDGSENWLDYQTTNPGLFGFNIRYEPYGLVWPQNPMCNTYAVEEKQPADYRDFTCGIDQYGNLWIRDSRYTSVSEFKAYLQTAGVKFVARRQTPQTVELGSIDLPTYSSDQANVWVSSNIDTTMRVDFPITSYLTVERLMPDGTRWTVGTNIADGDECIDPLPPLNLDYRYLVTASTEAGASATTNVDAFVDSNSTAFNFGDAASTCELLTLNPSWSRSPSIATELYDFADGGESGGLPMAYSTDSLTVGGQEAASTLDLDQYRRLLAIARTYPVGWVRDQLGGRQYCALAWSFSGGIPRKLVECTVDMDEIRFKEAW